MVQVVLTRGSLSTATQIESVLQLTKTPGSKHPVPSDYKLRNLLKGISVSCSFQRSHEPLAYHTVRMVGFEAWSAQEQWHSWLKCYTEVQAFLDQVKKHHLPFVNNLEVDPSDLIREDFKSSVVCQP